MLKKDIKSFDKNVFDEIGNKSAILISGDKNGFNGMTISWGGLGVLWNKNVAFVFVRHSRYTYEFIEKSDSVTLSFLSDKYKKEKGMFGSLSGRNVDKFEETGLHHTYDPDFDGYYITECDYVFKCKKLYSIDLNDLPKDINDKFYKDNDIHKMYVCEIKQYLVKNMED